MNWKKLLSVIALIALAAVVIVPKLPVFNVDVPNYPAETKTLWLDQNWSEDQRVWYHHASQGTRTFGVPYEWFMALEQPVLSLKEQKLLSDPTYLDRFGFIPDATNLPVGLAKGGPMVDAASGETWTSPQTKTAMTEIGLTCAACHTGRLTYRGTSLFIDGGAGLIDTGKLQKALGLSIAFTKYIPFRFERFAKRVLGPEASLKARAELKQTLDTLLERGKAVLALDEKVKDQSVVEGFGRLDALNRIGNQVFSVDLKNDANYVGTSAPVNFPHIWNAPWFDWVQYNGSIEQPMVRNAGEALGVRAGINLVDPARPLFASSIDVKHLFEMEQLLAGRAPHAEQRFSGLNSPVWPDVFPKIDAQKAQAGERLYAEMCQGCHLPPMRSAAFWEDKNWTAENPARERYLRLNMIDIAYLGTDEAQAEDMFNRKVATPPELGIASSSFGLALGDLTQKVANRWYDDQNPVLSEAQREEINGFRANGIRAERKYKARPLNGIWATAPYLHNGSVPNLYALLSPVKERPQTFYLGGREYDPALVGYQTGALAGGFKLDTALRGNRNTGHEFNDGPRGKGVIGRLLSVEERQALVEYLKTL